MSAKGFDRRHWRENNANFVEVGIAVSRGELHGANGAARQAEPLPPALCAVVGAETTDMVRGKRVGWRYSAHGV